MRPRLTAHIALLLTNFFFAANFSAIKFLMNKSLVEPFGLNVIRAGFTAILLWVFFFFKKSSITIHRSDWPRFILCGITGIAINQLLFLKGLQLTYPIHAALLMLVTPVIITIAAAFFLNEPLTFSKWIGLATGITGAAILISSRKVGGSASSPVWGDILVIINAISYAVYFILVRPLMEKYPPVLILRIIFTVGLAFIIPVGFTEFIRTPWVGYHFTEWSVMFLIVVCGTLLAYLFNVFGIRHLGASIAGSYIYVQPAFATIIAMIVLEEKLSWIEVVAGLLIFSGVYFSNKKQKLRQAQPLRKG